MEENYSREKNLGSNGQTFDPRRGPRRGGEDPHRGGGDPPRGGKDKFVCVWVWGRGGSAAHCMHRNIQSRIPQKMVGDGRISRFSIFDPGPGLFKQK